MREEFADITAANVEAFVPLFVSAFGAPPWNVPWSAEAAGERLAAFCTFPRFRGFGLRIDGEPAGLVLGWGERWSRGWVFHVKEMCVAPALQHRGLGRALLARFERALAEDRYESIYLETSGLEPSRAFYEKQGYAPLDLVSLQKRIRSV